MPIEEVKRILLNIQKEIYREIDALDEIHEFINKKAYFKTLDIVNKYLKEVEK